MFAGMALFSIDTALDVHAVAAPVIFAAISWLYWSKHRSTAPFTAAVVVTLTVVALDFFIVAIVINQSLDMFQSLVGTWIPFGLIFLSTYLTGRAIKTRADQAQSAQHG
jgi:uncharacterized integral membrane protein